MKDFFKLNFKKKKKGKTTEIFSLYRVAGREKEGH